MISNEDFEKVWFLYRTEGQPKGMSINSFCIQQGVPYNKFNSWFKTHMKHVVPVTVDGMPDDDPYPIEETSAAAPSTAPSAKEEKSPERENRPRQSRGGIMVTIHTRDGLHLSKSNLDYRGLKELVEKLEGVC